MPRPKISICINTQNEGPRLQATVDDFRAHLGEYPHEFVIVADAVTDGCCDDLMGADVILRRNTRRMGCGRCKGQAIERATGDVLVFLDAHMHMLMGDLPAMAARVYVDDCIYTPVLRDIGYDAEWRHTERTGTNLIPYNAGMQISAKGQYQSKSDQWVCEHDGSPIGMVGVGFAISQKSLARMGGFNRYQGAHGSQERGISLRAYMSQVDIRLDGSVIMGHEYRKDRPKPTGYVRGSARDQARNFWQAYYLMADDPAFRVLRPLLKNAAKKGEGITAHPDVIAERAEYLKTYRRRTDDDLLELLGLKK